jgi:DNA repair protein RecO (recombination protein O)
MDRFIDRAFVLATLDYGDSDRLVTLLTREHGKVTAFASGARKSKRRFAGALEPTTLLRAQLVERSSDTVRIDGADIERHFHRIRDDLPRIARALYCLELCRELLKDREPHPQLFDLLQRYLEMLDEGAAGPTSLLAFELSALQYAGFQPSFGSCAICGGAPDSAPSFDPQHGGVVCPRCRGRAEGALGISVELASGLAALQRGVRQPLPEPVRREARTVLNHFIDCQIGRKLKSVEFMRQLYLD